MATDIRDKSSRSILALVRDKTDKSVAWSIAKTVLKQLSVFGLSILLARIPFTDGIYPFGLAFVIGVPDKFFIASLVGFVFNNWIGDVVVGANAAYIGAVGVVAALRWIMAGVSRGKYHKNSYLPGLAAGMLSVFIAESAILILTGTLSFATFGKLAGGISLAGAFSYFYHTSFDSLKRRRTITELSSTQKASVALALCSALMSLYPLNLGPFSLGRIVSACAVIYAAQLLSPPLDAAVFASAAAAIALCEPGLAFAGAGLCVSGVLASLFRKKGRAWMCLIFLVAAALMSVTALNYVYSLTYISEILFASLAFLVIPLKGLGDMKFSKLGDSLTSATAAISIKLDSITSSMRDVTLLLDKTSSASVKSPDMNELYSRSVEKVCRNCANASSCWVKYYDDSSEAMNRLTPALRQRGMVARGDFCAPFSLRCTNMAGLAREVTERYAAMSESTARIKSTMQYKSMIKKQFGAVCDMLDTAKNELTAYKEWDEVKSKRIFDCAARLQLPVETASCVYDDHKRPFVTVALRDTPPEKLIRRLTGGIGIIVGAPLGVPSIEFANGNTVLCFTERPKYNVKTAAAQICADGKQCGDIYNIFSDLRGNVHILLSDGMGTGIAAAREGTICCAFLKRLLESGFPIQRAAELANSALALREDTESASTIDVLSMNVFDGSARLFKAGAAPTFCLRGSKILRLDGQTLPVGILDNVVSKELTLPLGDGDIIVMTSDGIQSEDCGIIEESLKTSFGATPEELCREIMRRSRDIGGITDDITVIVAKIMRQKDDESEQ